MKPSEILSSSLIQMDDWNQDRATSTNGKGFNKLDSSNDVILSLVGWVRAGKPLSLAQAKLVLKRLIKYNNTQLGGSLPTEEEIEREFKARELVRAARPVIHEMILDADNQIAVVNEPFDYGFVEKCKKLGGSFQALPTRKAWRFKRVKLAELHKAFPSFELDAVLQEELDNQWKNEQSMEKARQEEKTRLLNQVNLTEPIGSIRLMPHQQSGVTWGLERGRGILAFAPGLGKTYIGSTWALAHSRLGRTVLACVPKSMVGDWYESAANIGVPINCYTHHYRKIPQPLEAQEYVVVVDEAHKYKNPKAKCTVAMLELVRHPNCKGVLLLTGTPMLNGRPVELEPLLAMVEWPELLPYDSASKAEYERHYCNAHQEYIGNQRIWVVDSIPEEPIMRELRAKIMAVDGKGGYVYYKTADDTDLNLPELTLSRKKVSLEPKEKTAYDKRIKEARDAYQVASQGREAARVSDLEEAIALAVEMGDAETAKVLEKMKREKPGDAAMLVALTNVRRISETVKVPTALDMVDELIQAGEKVVIFCNYMETVDALLSGLSHLEDSGEVRPVRLTGDSPNRGDLVRSFQDGNGQVFVTTYGAGSEGITLTASRHMLLMGLPWTPGRLEQATKRIHRISQNRPAFVTTLTFDSIDDMMYNSLVKKSSSIETLLEEDMKGAALSIVKGMMNGKLT